MPCRNVGIYLCHILEDLNANTVWGYWCARCVPQALYPEGTVESAPSGPPTSHVHRGTSECRLVRAHPTFLPVVGVAASSQSVSPQLLWGLASDWTPSNSCYPRERPAHQNKLSCYKVNGTLICGVCILLLVWYRMMWVLIRLRNVNIVWWYITYI
jgi:hypothetical protein